MPLLDGTRSVGCCAIILAGGRNTRMNGRNKAFLDIGGRTILDRLTQSLQTVFSDILLVTRQPDLYADRAFRVVQDIYTDRSSLTGIHAGLVNARTEFGFTVPCDTPFLQPALVRMLLDECEPDLDVVVPFFDGHYQPLCAIYSKRCIPVIEEQLSSRNYKIINFFDRLNVKTVFGEKLSVADPELLSFFNVNTPEAYAACRELNAAKSKKKE